MLRIIAGAALSGTLALGAINASDTASQGRTDVNRALKGDRLPLPKVQSTCPEDVRPNYESGCLRKNTQPGVTPILNRSVRLASGF